MLPPLPRCSRWAYSSLKNHPSVSAFPDSTFGSACTSSFSRFARRSLALRPAHSRSHLGDRYPGASDISSPPCLPRLLPAGAVAGRGLHPLEKRRLVTAHVDKRSLSISRFSAARSAPASSSVSSNCMPQRIATTSQDRPSQAHRDRERPIRRSGLTRAASAARRSVP